MTTVAILVLGNFNRGWGMGMGGKERVQKVGAGEVARTCQPKIYYEINNS